MFYASTDRELAGRAALRRTVSVFFDGSTTDVVRVLFDIFPLRARKAGPGEVLANLESLDE